MNPLKWLLDKLPKDNNNSAGYGPFRLPDRCAWMQRAATLHDYDYKESDTDPGAKQRSEADWDLFYRWVLEAKSCQNPIERCHRAKDICEFWPIARNVGLYLWGKP